MAWKIKLRKRFKTKTAVFEYMGERIPEIKVDRKLNLYYFELIDEETGKTKKITSRDKHKIYKKYKYCLNPRTPIREYRIDGIYVEPDFEQRETPLHLTPDHIAELDKALPKDKGKKQVLVEDVETGKLIPEWWVMDRFAEFLETPERRGELAKKLGIEQIEYLPDLEPKKKLPLKRILEFYVNRTVEPVSKKTKRDAIAFWGEFIKLTKCKNLDDISKSKLRYYHDQIHKVADGQSGSWLTAKQKKALKGKGGKLSPTWVNMRLQMIKTVLNNAIKHIDDKNQLQTINDVMLLIQSLWRYKSPVPKNPKPITPEEFYKLFKHAKLKLRAILALCVNAGLYAKDIADLQKSDINFENGEFRMVRQKTGQIRIAFLSPIAIRLLKDYYHKDVKAKNSKSVFVSQLGGAQSSYSIIKMFRRLREKAELPDDVKLNGLRDASATTAAQAGCSREEINYLLGHAQGITDHYLYRTSDLVGKSCAAIHDKYLKPVEHLI